METYASVDEAEVSKILRRKLPWLTKKCTELILDAANDPHAVGILIRPKSGKLLSPLIGRDDSFPKEDFLVALKDLMSHLDTRVITSEKYKLLDPRIVSLLYKTLAAEIVTKDLQRITAKMDRGSVEEILESPWQIPENVLRLFNYLDRIDLSRRVTRLTNTSSISGIPPSVDYNSLLENRFISFTHQKLGKKVLPVNWALITLDVHRKSMSNTIH